MAIPTQESNETMADLHERLGFVPLDRIRMKPPIGCATEVDVIQFLDAPHKRLYELVDGTLVEKSVGTRESIIAAALILRIGQYVDQHDLGVLTGADGAFRMLDGNVRYPDVSFIPWSAFPDRKIPADAIWSIAPALAIEVISESNTELEIDRKLKELFALGCQLCWVIYPGNETARVYHGNMHYTTIDAQGVLDGGGVLPGFQLPLASIFASFKKFN